jgi:hypothetical protein
MMRNPPEVEDQDNMLMVQDKTGSESQPPQGEAKIIKICTPRALARIRGEEMSCRHKGFEAVLGGGLPLLVFETRLH